VRIASDILLIESGTLMMVDAVQNLGRK